MEHVWIYLVVLAIAAVAFAAWRRRRGALGEAGRRRGMAEFNQCHGRLSDLFLKAAAATGKPRGLRWASCEWAGDPLFAVDAESGRLFALAGVTVAFEAVEGGPMEDVEAVGNLRSATAVFQYRDGSWTSDGRAIFNLEPAEAMRRFESTLKPIAMEAPSLG